MTRVATRRPPEQRRAEILVAARAVLRERGYERFVTSEVAARGGVSEALVYRYFPTKRDLLARVAEAWFGELLSVGPAGLEQHHRTFDRLRYLVEYSLDVVRSEPSLSRYVLLELRSDPGYRSSELYELNRRFTGLVRDLLTEAVRSGELRDDVSVALLRDMIFGAIEHQTWAYLRDEGDFSPSVTAEGIARVIYRGMAPPRMGDQEHVDR